MITLSPTWMLELPFGMMILPPRLMQATSTSGLTLSSDSGMPTTGESFWIRNSTASTLFSMILYRLSTLLPMEFCSART